MGGKRRLIREEGLASRVSSHVRPRDPGGGGTAPTVSPRWMTIDDISHTLELSGGGGLSWSLPGFRQCGPRRPWLGDTPGRECPHDDVGIRPQMGTVWMPDDRVPSTNIESPYGGRPSSLPGATGSLLPVKFPAASVLLADRPQLGSWKVAVVRVDEIPVGDTSGRKCPRKCLPVVLAEGYPLAGAVNPGGRDGPVVAGGPVGPCETTSPSSYGALEPLEHSVLIHADPVGQHAAVGMLSPSDCYPAGPAGPCVAGGPVGPDDYLQVLEPLEHSVLDHVDPAGQHADVQDTVASLGAFGS